MLDAKGLGAASKSCSSFAPEGLLIEDKDARQDWRAAEV
jgi:hypothetical protein